MTPDEEVDARIDRLEALLADDKFRSGLDRLASQTDSLSVVLESMRSNSERMRRVEQRLEVAATHDEVESVDRGLQRLKDQRVKLLLVILPSLIALAVIMVVTILYARAVDQERRSGQNSRVRAANAQCEDNAVRVDVQVGVYRAVIKTLPAESPLVEVFQDGITEYLKTKSDCDKLFPLPPS